MLGCTWRRVVGAFQRCSYHASQYWATVWEILYRCCISYDAWRTGPSSGIGALIRTEKSFILDGNCWNVGCLSDIVYNHQLMKFINNSVSIVYTKLYWSHKKWIFLHDFTSMCRFDSVGNRHTGMLLSWQMSWHAEIHHTHNMCHSGRTTDISLTILLGDYDPQQVSFHHRYRPSLELPSLCMRYKLY